jgi:uncharacterized membrane protein YphA (DoxX/SURF4 family)
MVNFWTVMGGIAAGALLTQLAPLEQEILAFRWYLALYFVSSFLTIVNSWMQSSWGSLVLHWPLSVPGTLIYFAGLFCLSIQSLLVTRPAGWMAASSAVVFLAILIQYYFSRSGAWVVFSAEKIDGFRKNQRIYFFILFLTLLGAVQLTLSPSQLAEMIWGVITLVISILALVIQHKGMQQEKIDLGIP